MFAWFTYAVVGCRSASAEADCSSLFGLNSCFARRCHVAAPVGQLELVADVVLLPVWGHTVASALSCMLLLGGATVLVGCALGRSPAKHWTCKHTV
jgi:hypothetical protein